MKPLRLATAWLSGCSGCHMSLLNLHEHLLELLAQCELVYSPLMDVKEYPAGVDIVMVEGAVGTRENRALAELIRERTTCVVSLGDCAVNGNVSALRNPRGIQHALQVSYPDNAGRLGGNSQEVSVLQTVKPLHHVIRVDAFLPGCPPEAGQIQMVLQKLIAGEYK